MEKSKSKRTSIRRKLFGFSFILFLAIFTTGGIAFIYSMQDITRSSKAHELLQTVELEKTRLESSVMGEIAIALKMAGSPLLIKHFLNPSDAELKKIAFDEIAGYRRAFGSNTVFWVSDVDKKFHSDDAYVYTVDDKDPANYWYPMTMNETDRYNFNINYNEHMKKIMLWINAVVKDDKGKSVGIVGTGIDLSSFTEAIYKSYTGKADLYFFNGAGEITGARDVNLVTNKALVAETLGETGTEIQNCVKELSKDGELTFVIHDVVVAVGAIPILGWHIALIQPLIMHDYLDNNMTVVFSVMMAVIALIFIIFNVFVHTLINPLRRMVAILKKVSADWDMTQKIPQRSKDEIGEIAFSFNYLIDEFRAPIAQAKSVTDTLASASGKLSTVSDRLYASSEDTVAQSIAVSKDSEDTSKNVHEIASEAERASATATELSATAEMMGTNMSAMAKAVGEMNESFNKITADTRESKAIADVATEKVAGAMEVMDALGSSAKEIWQFTDVIKSIAQKTNLLALNATVEAARAGEAGKGFAVVAGEVKQLANQSASNADDITRRIENIQGGTKRAIDAIKEISAIITKISASAHSISEGVERQIKVSDNLASTARDTNASAQQVVQAVGDVANSVQITAKNAGDAADGAKNVSDSIVIIHEDAEKTNAYSTELKEAANSLKAMAESLDSIVSKFKT